jgi:hypothetical protein
MLKDYEPPEIEPVPPECRATVEMIQRVLDGDATADVLDADSHTIACAACRERVRAARVLLSVLATPAEPVAVPAEFADRVVTAMWVERHERTRRRSYAAAMWTIAAGILLVIGLTEFFRPPQPVDFPDPKLVATTPEPAPEPRPNPPAPEPVPEPRPIRVGDALASTGQAILDAPKPFAESVAVAPKLLDVLSGPFKMPAAAADPMTVSLEPARKSLADLPDAARTGLEPVTGTAEKAFARFLRDMGSVKPNS